MVSIAYDHSVWFSSHFIRSDFSDESVKVSYSFVLQISKDLFAFL